MIGVAGLLWVDCRSCTPMTLLPAARRLFGDVATRLQVPLSGEPIIRYRQPPASLVRHGCCRLCCQRRPHLCRRHACPSPWAARTFVILLSLERHVTGASALQVRHPARPRRGRRRGPARRGRGDGGARGPRG